MQQELAKDEVMTENLISQPFPVIHGFYLNMNTAEFDIALKNLHAKHAGSIVKNFDVDGEQWVVLYSSRNAIYTKFNWYTTRGIFRAKKHPEHDAYCEFTFSARDIFKVGSTSIEAFAEMFNKAYGTSIKVREQTVRNRKEKTSSAYDDECCITINNRLEWPSTYIIYETSENMIGRLNKPKPDFS